MVRRTAMVLEPLNKNAPGMPSVLYELARVKYLCGEQGGRGGVKGQRTKVKKRWGKGIMVPVTMDFSCIEIFICHDG